MGVKFDAISEIVELLHRQVQRALALIINSIWIHENRKQASAPEFTRKTVRIPENS